MSNKSKKIIAVCLCAALCIGGAGLAFALPAAEKENEPIVAAAQQDSSVEQKISKDETVYVLANADGSVQKIIVSDWLKNQLGSAFITDKSTLDNIQNVKGNESYSINGDHMTVWDAQGNDIYYQGNIQKELPVGMTVRYSLDGKSISPDQLKGKSGKVSIRFDYENYQYETVDISGTSQRIYVPFAMLTGMILDNDSFRNVQVTNGKLVNDGDRTVVVGLAFPGLQENLNLSADQLSIPDSVEITADVTDFSMGMTVTLACNDLFSQLDDFNPDTADASSSLSKLTDAMGQLMDGSSALYDGLTTLLDKSNELVAGVEELAKGAADIKDGANSLDEGAIALKNGLSDLSSGLNTLSSNSGKLNDGAKQVFQTLLNTATSQIRESGLTVQDLTVDNYAETLNALITSLDETSVYKQALQQVTEALEAKRPEIKQSVTAAVRAQVEEKVKETVRSQVEAKVADAVRTQVADKVTASVRMQVEEKVTETIREQVTESVTAAVKETVTNQVIQAATGMNKSDYESAVAAGMISLESQAAINAAVTQQMASDAVAEQITQTVAQQMESQSIQDKITQAVTQQMTGEAVQNTISQATEQQMTSTAVQDTLSQAVAQQMESQDIRSTITANTDKQMQAESIQTTISQQTEVYVQKAISENMAGDAVQSKLQQASQGAQTLIGLKASLDDYNVFYLGLLDYTAGVDTAAAGAGELSAGADALQEGTAQLRTGAATLYSGVLKLKDGTPALVSGVEQLKDGSMQLSQGLQQLNKDGIEKLVRLLQEDLGDLSERVQATIDVSKNYRSFSGIHNDADGQVKFIYRTDEIE